MTARTHLGLRLGGLLVLVGLVLLPKTRGAHHDPAISTVARAAHVMETVAAKPSGTLVDDKPRPRTATGFAASGFAGTSTHGPSVVLDVVADVDESRLTN